MLPLLGLLSVAVVLWLTTWALHWRLRAVPSPVPLPLLGNCLSLIYLSSFRFWQRLYHSFTDPYLGIFLFTRPVLLLKDTEVILEVLEKKASCFNSHGLQIDQKRDPMGKSIFHISGQEWKDVRSFLSAYFTPAKVKAMSGMAEKSADRLVEYLSLRLGSDINMHSAAMMFTIDVTAAAIFGVESNVFKDGDQSEFFKAAKDLNTPSSMIKVLVNYVSPALFRLLRLNSSSSESIEFTRNLVSTSARACKQNPELHNFIQGVLRRNYENKCDEATMTHSQGAALWTGGVETTAATLSFCLFELAGDPSLQQQLLCSSPLSRLVVTETLRKYPPFSLLTRCCTTSCTLDSGLQLSEGNLLFIPTYSLHHDPAIYPEPELFRPGREYPRGAYLPFGAGPRTCIGMKMAETVLEVALRKLLGKFRFSRSSKSQTPLQLSPRTFFTTAEGGVWLKIEKQQSD